MAFCGAAFGTRAAAAPAAIATRIEAVPEQAYVGGMPPLVVRIAAELRQRLQAARNAPLPACGRPDPLRGSIVATALGSTPAPSQAQDDAVLRELQHLLGSERRFVRDAAAYLVGEIGPAAASLEPDLGGHDVGRSAWFSHALGRVTCERYSMDGSLDSIPPAVRMARAADGEAIRTARSKARLVAELLRDADLQWPDGFFAGAIEPHELHAEGRPAGRIEPVWIHAIADRLIDESSSTRLRVDLAQLLSNFGPAARPAAEKLWQWGQKQDGQLAFAIAEAVAQTGGDRALDATKSLLERFDADVSVIPEGLCGSERAARTLGPPLRARLIGASWREATQAARKLACIDPIGSAAALRAALDHPSWEVQRAAIVALAESARSDPRTRAALERVGREHWSGLIRKEAAEALNPPPPEEPEPDTLSRIDFNCFHRCLTDHLRRCGDDQGIVDGLYVSPSLGTLDIEWERARRMPRPAGFPVAVDEDSRAGYGTSTYLRVEGGWLYGTDRWHYDGELAFVDDAGRRTPIAVAGEDPAAIIDTPHFGTVMLGRSLLGVGQAGLLASLERAREGWRIVPKTTLPNPPWGWAFAPDGTLLVADPYEAVAVLRDGRIESLACPAQAPEPVPRSLRAMAGRVARKPSERKQREALDALQVHAAQFAARRERSLELAREPGRRESWEAPEIVQERLDRDLDELLEAYLAAGRAEAGIALLESLPAGLGHAGPGRRFQLYAVAGRVDEARAQLDAAAVATDALALKMRAAIALAERRPAQARDALDRIDAQRSRDEYAEADRYLEMLRWLAAEPGGAAAALPVAEQWPGPIQAHLGGRIGERELVLASHRRDGRVDREKLCEALFYRGLELARDGRARAARAHFRAVARLGVEHFFEHAVALVLK